MDRLESYVVDDAFRGRVRSTIDRLGPVALVAEPRWQPFAARLGLGPVSGPASVDAAAFVVGAPAAVLRHARQEVGDFGFVMPVARLKKPWQRGSQWRDDATLDLWQAGWTPITIDRLLVAGEDATVEFVIGTARQTPVRTDA